MEKPGSMRTVGGGIEENILAILDSSEAKDTLDAFEDRVAFIEAVRAASIVAKNGTPPTYKMYEAIFSILRIGKSLELTMASFQLLNELDKRFPRVNSSNVDKSNSSSSVPELIMVQEVWFPFVFSSKNASRERGAANNSEGPVDSSGFQLLIQDLADATDEGNLRASETKPSVRTRRSNSPTDDASFIGALKCFSNITSTKSANSILWKLDKH
ncbi:hypothetical protein GBA52_012938 [Prunus armeniaca]|nr:hypothetical protein GBA52_012938 [Prunus armeniaca]